MFIIMLKTLHWEKEKLNDKKKMIAWIFFNQFFIEFL